MKKSLLLFFLSLCNFTLLAQTSSDLLTFLGQKVYEKNKEQDYYKFGDRGDLVSFRISFQDGTVLEANLMEESKSNEYGIPWKSVRTFPSGVRIALEGEFYTEGPTSQYSGLIKISDLYQMLDKHRDINRYWDFVEESFKSSLSMTKWSHYGFSIDLPGGVSLSNPFAISNSYSITVSDKYGNSDILDDSFNNDIDLDFGEYRATTISHFKNENEPEMTTILYSDGRRFEGKVSFQQDADKAHPLYKMVIPFLREHVINENNADYPDFNRMISAVYPKEGILYDKNGTMIGEYVSQSEFYEATSDGKVREVYIDGIAMAPGFERDKKISEYAGLLNKRAEELRAREEERKRVAEFYANKEMEKKEKLERLYAQYGRTNVDAVMKGKVPIGIPESLLQHVNGLVSRDIVGANYNHYTVTVFTVLGNVEMGVWTSNGKVTTVIYH